VARATTACLVEQGFRPRLSDDNISRSVSHFTGQILCTGLTMRRPKISIRGVLISVAASALLIWGGLQSVPIARDLHSYVWPPPPLQPGAPWWPVNQWIYPDRVVHQYINMNDSRKGVKPVRTLIWSTMNRDYDDRKQPKSAK
jgi:hypothetical protein